MAKKAATTKKLPVEKMEEQVGAVASTFIPAEANGSWQSTVATETKNELGEPISNKVIHGAAVYFTNGERSRSNTTPEGVQAAGSSRFLVQFPALDAEDPWEPQEGDVLIRGVKRWRVTEIKRQEVEGQPCFWDCRGNRIQ